MIIQESETQKKSNHCYYYNDNGVRYFDKDFFFGKEEFVTELYELICHEKKDYIDYDIFIKHSDYGEVCDDKLVKFKEM